MSFTASRLACPVSVQAAAPRAGRMAWLVRGLMAGIAAALVGCASVPTPSTPGARPVGNERQPGVTRSPDRDGAPGQPPPDLDKLPDPVPQVERIRSGGPNKPYVVLGQSYEPSSADIAWKERGRASWYGTKFHGRRTASGELFSMYGLTAAHRTLPIPSYARVRNLGNGREIIVRVNDRGPFHSNRVMDLSYAAAAKLGVLSAGSAEVEIQRLTFDDIRTGAWRRNTEADGTLAKADEPSPMPSVTGGSNMGLTDDPIQAIAAQAAVRPAVAPETEAPAAAIRPVREQRGRAYTNAAQGYWVQLAALGRREGVDRLQQRVAGELSALLPLLSVFHEGAIFKLQVGPYASRDEALAAAGQAREALQLTPMVVERR